MNNLKLKLGGSEMLTREQMKMIGGGDCAATIKCSDGTTHQGFINCEDLGDGNADSDVICNSVGGGDSTSCDCA